MAKKNIHPGFAIAAAAVGFALFGRYLLASLVSKRAGKPIRWRPPSASLNIGCPGGNMLHVETDGPSSAPVLVFIHGVNADHRQWYYQREHFKEKYRLIFVDLPLQHTATCTDLSIPVLAANLSHVLQQLDVKDAIAYGHSMGGTVLLEYCLRPGTQSRLKAAVLHGTPYNNPVFANRYHGLLRLLQKPVIVPLLNLLKKYKKVFNILSALNYLNGVAPLAYRFVHFTGGQTTNELLYVTSMAPGNDTAAVAESVLQLMSYDATARLQQVNLPVLIISGLDDQLNMPGYGKHLHSLIPRARYVAIKGGHQNMVESHAAVNAVLADFIAGFTKSY